MSTTYFIAGIIRAMVYASQTEQGMHKMTEILIYGIAKDQTERYMEDLLSTQCKTEQDIKNLIAKASAHGFHSFRVTTYNGEAPNFVKSLTI